MSSSRFSPRQPSTQLAANVRHRPLSLRGVVAGRCAVVAVGIAVLPAVAAPPAAATEQFPHVPGRLLVQQRAGLSDAQVDSALSAHGGKRVGKIDGINVHVVQLPAHADTAAAAAALARNPHFKFVELDRILPLAGTTNDPSLASQWHLTRIGAPTAWDTTAGDGITIAILDTGVDGSHPDLAAQMVAGWNAYDNNADASDIHGHGTAVAGTAAAAGNNQIGVASVAYRSRIMPIRVADAGGYATGSAIASGLTWAADHGATVANISFEGVPGNTTIDSAAQYLKGKGGVTVVAAGNGGASQNIVSTGNMVVVSATDSNDLLASWSNYGSYVNIAAPGTPILTTSRGGGYGQWWGTSFSSPIVAGTAALMIAANRALPLSQVQSLLYSTAVDLGSAGKDAYYGAGRVNAAGATQAAAVASAVDAQAPTVAISAPTGGSVSGLVAVDVVASDTVGVARVELVVNGSTYASDTTSPYGFSWDTSRLANGVANLKAYAYDAAGNYSGSQAVSVMVANAPTAPDTEAPTVAIVSPVHGATVSGNGVAISGTASDNLGASGITLSLAIDEKVTTTVTGGSLRSNWNLRKVAAGSHRLTLTARDVAGNTASTTITVFK